MWESEELQSSKRKNPIQRELQRPPRNSHQRHHAANQGNQRWHTSLKIWRIWRSSKGPTERLETIPLLQWDHKPPGGNQEKEPKNEKALSVGSSD